MSTCEWVCRITYICNRNANRKLRSITIAYWYNYIFGYRAFAALKSRIAIWFSATHNRRYSVTSYSIREYSIFMYIDAKLVNFFCTFLAHKNSFAAAWPNAVFRILCCWKVRVICNVPLHSSSFRSTDGGCVVVGNRCAARFFVSSQRVSLYVVYACVMCDFVYISEMCVFASDV